MKLKMAKMNTCSQFYFHIELLTKLEHVIPHFNLCMDTSIIAYKIFVMTICVLAITYSVLW